MAKNKNNSTELKEKVNHDFLLMAPDALDALHDMMTDPKEESIRIQNDQESFDAAQERLDELFLLAKEQDSARHDE